MIDRDKMLQDIRLEKERREAFMDKWLNDNVKPDKKPTIKNIVEAMITYLANERGIKLKKYDD